MKKILSMFIIIVGVLISAQDLKYEEVIKVDSTLVKDELFNRARTWAKENFNDKNNLITIEDKDSGEVSGTCVFDYRTEKKYKGYSCVEVPIRYNFSIYVKDGRFKYVFSTFDHKGSSGNLCRAGNFGKLTITNDAPSIGKGIAFDLAWIDVKEKIRFRVDNIVSSLEKGMNKKYEGSADW